jgi:thiol-disulfide isomerase/thioredoxin
MENYYLKGRCPWVSEGTLYNMRYNYNRIRQSIIGAHGQELLMLDTTQIDAPEHWISSHRFPEKYVILWFWDPDCHHCQEQSAELKVLYDSLQTAPDHRFEVYAVGYESDVAKWKKYVREHDFRWKNVGGSNVNIDYQEAYNVHGAPTMIILNERRDIIMNKVLPIKSLLQFLDNYEKRNK